MTEVAKGKFIYGIVTVGERGQIVIPKEARNQFGIKAGEKLVVAGDVTKRDITIVKADRMKEFAQRILGALGEVEEGTEKEG